MGRNWGDLPKPEKILANNSWQGEVLPEAIPQLEFYSVFIPHVFPGRNEQEAKARSSRYSAGTMKTKFTDIAQMYFITLARKLKQENKSFKGLPQCDFVFHFVEKNKKRDPDNISAGMKFIYDGIVKSGVMDNDGWRNVRNIDLRFEVDKKAGVRINIFPVE